jgi:hypothetical protein
MQKIPRKTFNRPFRSKGRGKRGLIAVKLPSLPHLPMGACPRTHKFLIASQIAQCANICCDLSGRDSGVCLCKVRGCWFCFRCVLVGTFTSSFLEQSPLSHIPSKLLVVLSIFRVNLPSVSATGRSREGLAPLKDIPPDVKLLVVSASRQS